VVRAVKGPVEGYGHTLCRPHELLADLYVDVPFAGQASYGNAIDAKRLA